MLYSPYRTASRAHCLNIIISKTIYHVFSDHIMHFQMGTVAHSYLYDSEASLGAFSGALGKSRAGKSETRGANVR